MWLMCKKVDNECRFKVIKEKNIARKMGDDTIHIYLYKSV